MIWDRWLPLTYRPAVISATGKAPGDYITHMFQLLNKSTSRTWARREGRQTTVLAGTFPGRLDRARRSSHQLGLRDAAAQANPHWLERPSEGIFETPLPPAIHAQPRSVNDQQPFWRLFSSGKFGHTRRRQVIGLPMNFTPSIFWPKPFAHCAQRTTRSRWERLRAIIQRGLARCAS